MLVGYPAPRRHRQPPTPGSESVIDISMLLACYTRQAVSRGNVLICDLIHHLVMGLLTWAFFFERLADSTQEKNLYVYFMTASGGKAERCNTKWNGKLDFSKMICQKGWPDANQTVNDCKRVHRGGKDGGGQMRKGAHCWVAADPVNMFNELNWFTGLAYILSTVSLYTVRCIIVACLIDRAGYTFTLRRAGYRHHLTLIVLSHIFHATKWKKESLKILKHSFLFTILSMNHMSISVWSTPGDQAN